MARETPVFISYARADERYATELMNRLALEPDIAPWQDRIKMSDGDFEDQIKSAIDSSDYFVLVMTPGALRSTWVEKEWRYARTNGHCVVPIKPAFGSDAIEAEYAVLRDQLPVWMQNTQTYDFDRYWKRFVAVLQNPCHATRSPFLVADLPANVVRRQDQFARIVGAILDGGKKNPSGKTLVLHGAGGFGKTTLALSVCHDADVFAACDGGILWVTLGEQPEILTLLERIYAALTGERPGFKDQDDAMFEVAKKLDGKRCLLVIDDVWREQDLRPFLYGAPATSRLVTTRIFSVALRAAPDEGCRITIGEVSANEAAQILSAGLPAAAGSAGRLGVLADRLKRVPLLLQLANRCLVHQVALGDTVEGALDWAMQKYADLGVVAFDDKDDSQQGKESRRDSVRETVKQTVEVSLSFLGDDRQPCLELGVLHEDTEIPFSVLAILWNKTEVDVQRTVERLHDFGLLLLDLPRRSIRLHDYIRDYLGGILPDAAGVHGRLVEAWTRGGQIPAGYPLERVVFHIVEAMADPGQVRLRAKQLVDLLSEPKFQGYQRRHGDAAALDRRLTLALRRAAEGTTPEVPALIAALVLLRKSYAAGARDAALVFERAAHGQLDAAVALLSLFEADKHWDTLARLLIAWNAPPDKADLARALVEAAGPSCNTPQLKAALNWVRQRGGGLAANLGPVAAAPDLRRISAVLQRAGGGEIEGLEPLNVEDLASGTDAAGFIAERDGPELVAFAMRDPAANTQYVERYIDIHAANRYAYYRNRSLWMLLQPILEFPDAAWVRRLTQRITTAALTVASVQYEEALPLAVRGLRGKAGDLEALAELETVREELIQTARTLNPAAGRTDSWGSYHRRASTLAEIYAVALGRSNDAVDLLNLARQLPKGFAGFRAPSALRLAESARIVAPADVERRDLALTSATAGSHRIQDYRFCLQMASQVNAIRFHWSDMRNVDLAATVSRFLARPLSAEFCASHRVLDQFEYREKDQQLFQALPIPEPVRRARTLREIAAIFDVDPQRLIGVNDWIWAPPAGVLDEVLQKDDEVRVPDEEFVPILAARFAAEAMVADGVPPEERTRIVQRLVRMALPNPTAVDTVLERLVLMAGSPQHFPAVLRNIALPDAASAGSPEDYDRSVTVT